MVIKLTIIEVLEPFLTKPYENLHLAEISRELNQPHPTVRQWLNIFEKKGVLKKKYQGRLTLYSLNLQNLNVVEYLIIVEKNKLIRKCQQWLILAEFVNYIVHNFNENSKALLFGSASESFDSANDVDLLVIGKQDLQGIKDLAKRFNKQMHIIQVNTLNKISNALRKETIKKHLIIKGSEDFIRWFLW